MNLLKLSWKNLTAKPLSSLLSVVLVALGVSLTSILLLLNAQFKDRLYKNIEGIHLVVGAKGSPLQMILSSVYHIDVPTGNIPLSEGKYLKNQFIEKAIPMALGDSYKTYRIVGTNYDYPALYKAELAEGKLWEKDLEVTAGAAVAKKLGLKIGSTFNGSHGLVGDGDMHVHEGMAYKVVGIFKPTSTIADQLLFTNVASVWRVHEEHGHGEEDLGDYDEDSTATSPDSSHAHHNHDGHDHSHDGHDHGHDHAHHDHSHDHAQPVHPDSLPPISTEGKEVTSYLVVFKKDGQGNTSAMASVQVPKIIDDLSDKMGYAYPARELQRLMDMTGTGATFLAMLAWVIIGVSALSVFISLYNSLKDRRYEIALMRVMGASRGKVFLLIVLEGVWIAALGSLLGLVLSHLGMALVAGYLEADYKYPFSGMLFLIEELYLVLGIFGIGFFAALLPALQAYNTEISKTLAQQ